MKDVFWRSASVPLPLNGLGELQRVCQSEGRVLMLEHVRSEGPVMGPLMDFLNPLPLYLYGANINRRAVDNLLKAGFRHLDVTNLWRDLNGSRRNMEFTSTTFDAGKVKYGIEKEISLLGEEIRSMVKMLNREGFEPESKILDAHVRMLEDEGIKS